VKKSNFIFLEREYPLLYNICLTAEHNLHGDPVVCLFKIRQFGEKITELLFEEHHLLFPEENTFHNRIKLLEFERIVPASITDLFFLIKGKGNIATHQNKGSVDDAKSCLFSAFKLAKWFYEAYSVENNTLDDVKFSMPLFINEGQIVKQLEEQYKQLAEQFNKLLAERNIAALNEDELSKIKARSVKAASKLDMSEAETRALIDEHLRQAGWLADTDTLNHKKNKTLPQRGKNIAIAEWPAGPNWADYALFIGYELFGFVEAKKYGQDISTDLRQSKVYAEIIEQKNEAVLLGKWDKYKVPFLFATNGRPYLEQIKTKSGIWFLDVRDKANTSRPLQGWYSPEGLLKLQEKDIQQANNTLKNADLDFLESKAGLGLRKYQIKAIKAIENAIIERPENRKVLIAMATGTGKTRTVIGLCYHLIQTNRFNRILFLVDRNLLGTQAINAFKDNKVVGLNTFAEIYDVKGLKDALPEDDTRLQFSTVQSIVKRLFYNSSDENVPAVDQYDCIVIDEAHRGYLIDKEMDEEELLFKNQQDYVSKYRMVLDYFDAYAIGITATPALHTKEIFGSPVYYYPYREAVIDGFLVDHEPPHQIETVLSKEGITWKKGEKPKAYDKESNTIIELEKLEDELHFDVAEFNKLVLSESFNRTVLKELVKELDPTGDGKTLIFAATDEHADTVVAILKDEFKKLNVDVEDDAIQKITGKSYKPQELFTRFKNEQYPNIAVTVDLLTTGIDVPKICSLVFLRRVKSRILYEQMLGRATRKCDEIGKEFFRIYDAVNLYETLEDYTQMKPVVVDPKVTFQQLVDEIDTIQTQDRVRKQVEQIIAKFQRKRKYLNEDTEGRFKYATGGLNAEGFINSLRNELDNDGGMPANLKQSKGIWKFLDELKPQPSFMMVSEHQDEYLATTRGYGKGKKPEDYLDSFASFINNNLNKLAALSIVCNRPKELDRKSLKELMILLDEAGYNALTLRTAWRDSKNEDIAADIISFIRTLAIGNSLVSHEERIKKAVNKVRGMKQWNAVQNKWIDRFEKQLLKETILQPQDLDEEPFKEEGGFVRLDKIFEHQLTNILDIINENLYSKSA
jgi:type I restriction enzyme R subunit